MRTSTLCDSWGVADPPSILALQLARFTRKNGRAHKLTTPIHPSWRIQVPVYDPDAKIILRWRYYRLIAIHLRHGSSLEEGHYTCMILGYTPIVMSEANYVPHPCGPTTLENSAPYACWSAHLNDAKAPKLLSITTTEQLEKLSHELSIQGYLYIYIAVDGHDPPRSRDHNVD